MSVGSNIKHRRIQLRMSQQELADAMGYKTRSTIAKIESGENDVSQKKLQKLALVLDTTVEALVSGYKANQESGQQQVYLADNTMHRNIVVILAGGKAGKNLRSIPSQYIHVHGKPIIAYCLDAYQNHPSISEIYIVCARGWESIVRDYADQYGITKLKGILPAGNCGVGSLKNAVDYICSGYAADDFVFVQEATRPLVTTETINKLLHACAEKGSATICYSMKDHVQFQWVEGQAQYVDRNALIALQSPEVHKLSMLRDVFDRVHRQRYILKESCFTMLLKNLGYRINFVESDINNTKITREEDIAVFEAMIKNASGK